MYYGQIDTSIDFNFTESVDSGSLKHDVIGVKDIDVSRFRNDLQTWQLELIDNVSLKKVVYIIPGQGPGGRFEASRTVKVPLNTIFPDANKARVLGYDFVADASSGGEMGVLTIHGKVNVKLRDYKEPEEDRSFDVMRPIGPSSIRYGLIGRIEYCGSSIEGTKIVRSVYDVLKRYSEEVRAKGSQSLFTETMLSPAKIPARELDLL